MLAWDKRPGNLKGGIEVGPVTHGFRSGLRPPLHPWLSIAPVLPIVGPGRHRTGGVPLLERRAIWI